MEREPRLTASEAMRAVRSLAWNRKLLPVIEGRIERAEQTIRSYLALQGTTIIHLGVYQVNLEEEEIDLTRRSTDGWQQLAIPELIGQVLPQAADIFVVEPAVEASCADMETSTLPV